MHPNSVDVLACPADRGRLDMHVHDRRDEEVVDGELVCRECGERYVVAGGIALLLPPDASS